MTALTKKLDEMVAHSQDVAEGVTDTVGIRVTTLAALCRVAGAAEGFRQEPCRATEVAIYDALTALSDALNVAAPSDRQRTAESDERSEDASHET